MVVIAIFLCFIAIPLNAVAATDSAQADFTPWSGWWWPSNAGGLATGADYQGHPAPLEKYDLLITGSYPGAATQYYLDNDYDPDAISWSGFCHAWASAAVTEKIVFFPSSNDNVIFNVGDKKGLLTACHEHDQRIYGSPENPAEFHYWLLNYIKDQGQAFYAELDPSVEAWNFPVYKYEMTYIKNGSVMDVSCTIWYASDFVHPDYQGTDPKTKTYTYTLVLFGDDIIDGQWTGNSVYDHPQVMVMPLAVGTYNPYLDYATVQEIAASRDDPLESEDAADLVPGGYNLILMDDDVFAINTLAGEHIFLAVENQDAISEGIHVAVRDKDGQTVDSALAYTNERLEFSIASDNPPYRVIVSRQDYSDVGYYRLECDLKRRFTFYNTNVEKGYGWGGFAMTNAGDTRIDDVCVTGYDRQGRPLETYAGPFSIAPGEKKTVLVPDFDVRMVDRNALYGVKIHSPQSLSVVNLSGYFNTNMSTAVETVSGNIYIIPDIQAGFSMVRSVYWGLSNRGAQAIPLHLTHFSKTGTRIDEADLVFSSNQAVQYTAVNQPLGKIQDGGWIKIQPDGSGPVGGYVQWLSRDLKYSERLPILVPATRMAVPHVVSSPRWAMQLVLINPNDDSNTVSIRLINGDSVSDQTLALAANEKKVLSMESFFQGIDPATVNQCGLLIQAGAPLAGYYTLEAQNGHLYFPLLDADKPGDRMIVPHVASGSYWWTCVNLFNPSNSQAAEVSLIPFDNQGQEMSAHIKTRTIAPFKKDVFSISAVWEDQAGQISFFKIQVAPGASLVGLYAYGNMDNSMVAGTTF